MKNERREFVRYTSTSKALGLQIHGHDVVEKILDIGMGGLAFEYQPIQSEKLRAVLIDIFWNDKSPSYLSMIPCEVIYDQATLPESRTFRGKLMRRCGLKYKSVLKSYQERFESLFSSKDMVVV